MNRTIASIGLGGISLVALLTGCSADDTATSSDTGGSASAGSDSTGSASPTTDGTSTDGTGSDGSSASSGDYADGEYSATGEYQSPGGTESIEVDLTLADGVVTAVTVTGDASGGNSERYQTQFSEGIADEVVGVAIDDLSVDRVAGSSLTSDGFNAAVEQIKADALA